MPSPSPHSNTFYVRDGDRMSGHMIKGASHSDAAALTGRRIREQLNAGRDVYVGRGRNKVALGMDVDHPDLQRDRLIRRTYLVTPESGRGRQIRRNSPGRKNPDYLPPRPSGTTTTTPAAAAKKKAKRKKPIRRTGKGRGTMLPSVW